MRGARARAFAHQTQEEATVFRDAFRKKAGWGVEISEQARAAPSRHHKFLAVTFKQEDTKKYLSSRRPLLARAQRLGAAGSFGAFQDSRKELGGTRRGRGSPFGIGRGVAAAPLSHRSSGQRLSSGRPLEGGRMTMHGQRTGPDSLPRSGRQRRRSLRGAASDYTVGVVLRVFSYFGNLHRIGSAIGALACCRVDRKPGAPASACARRCGQLRSGAHHRVRHLHCCMRSLRRPPMHRCRMRLRAYPVVSIVSSPQAQAPIDAASVPPVTPGRGGGQMTWAVAVRCLPC